jgi:hypothetical protein
MRTIAPMLVSGGPLRPDSDRYAFEVKWDGYRALVKGSVLEVSGGGAPRTRWKRHRFTASLIVSVLLLAGPFAEARPNNPYGMFVGTTGDGNVSMNGGGAGSTYSTSWEWHFAAVNSTNSAIRVSCKVSGFFTDMDDTEVLSEARSWHLILRCA